MLSLKYVWDTLRTKRRDYQCSGECLGKVTLLVESEKGAFKMGPSFVSCSILVKCCEHSKGSKDPRYVKKYMTIKRTLDRYIFQ